MDGVLELVSADTPALLALRAGKVPFHRVCGSKVDYVLHPVPGADGRYHFGTSCSKCMRELMEGEVIYVDSIDAGFHREPSN